MAKTMRPFGPGRMEAAPYFSFADAQGSGLIHMGPSQLDVPLVTKLLTNLWLMYTFIHLFVWLNTYKDILMNALKKTKNNGSQKCPRIIK